MAKTQQTATVFVLDDDRTNYLAYLAKSGMEVTRQRKSADERGWLITFNYPPSRGDTTMAEAITFNGTKHDTAVEALQHLECSGDDRAILTDAGIFTLSKAEAVRLEAAGVSFAYLFWNDTAGQIVTVPVNE